MRSIISVIFAALVMLTGCATSNKVLVATGTVIGVEIGQNPATGLYQAKLGYNRAEFALVPSTNSYTPNVLTELRYSGIFSTGSDSGIYQRLAVGEEAVKQPGALAMFLRDPSGNISSNTATALKSLMSSSSVEPGTQSKLVVVALAYKGTADKTPWDEVARENGYADFDSFLIDPKLSLEKLDAVSSGLRSRNLIQ